ncbi:unnamed protein product [Paramecium octaurelia]|uniref:Uncharacterized protein n=1 Tax=Paramecium octaurelia TaxID=43137 RepID=A0A8S1YQT1_PAROT|nr:unnamed protein product [Paramecium octaurelia]
MFYYINHKQTTQTHSIRTKKKIKYNQFNWVGLIKLVQLGEERCWYKKERELTNRNQEVNLNRGQTYGIRQNRRSTYNLRANIRCRISKELKAFPKNESGSPRRDCDQIEKVVLEKELIEIGGIEIIFNWISYAREKEGKDIVLPPENVFPKGLRSFWKSMDAVTTSNSYQFELEIS